MAGDTPTRLDVEGLLSEIADICDDHRASEDDITIWDLCRWVLHVEAERDAALVQLRSGDVQFTAAHERIEALELKVEQLTKERDAIEDTEVGDYWAVAEERDSERARAGELALKLVAAFEHIEALESALADALRLPTAENGEWSVCPWCRDDPCRPECMTKKWSALLTPSVEPIFTLAEVESFISGCMGNATDLRLWRAELDNIAEKLRSYIRRTDSNDRKGLEAMLKEWLDVARREHPLLAAQHQAKLLAMKLEDK